ncbi:transporter substrate-binding domain-containing protein [Francisellaceae bacterium]|nr:transporter substrate-binding domain-containing protein [Francisellaceae bacterium]
MRQFFLIIFTWIIFSSAYAEDNKLDSSKEVLQHITFYTESFPPFTYENDQGELKGYAVDIVEKVFENLGLSKPDIRLKVWDMAYMLTLISKNSSALFLISETPAREKQFHFSHELTKSKNAIYCNKAIGLKSLTSKDYNKYKFAVEKQDVNINFLRDIGIPAKNIIVLNSIEIAVEHVAAGRIACMAFSEPVINELSKSSEVLKDNIILVYNLPETKQSVGFNISIDESVIVLFNEQLEKVLNDQAYIHKLKAQYGVE